MGIKQRAPNVSAHINLAAHAWFCQMAFGGWQNHHFKPAFVSHFQKSSVGGGRSGGRLKTRGVVAGWGD
ncbi:transcriptional regulator GutM [Enterobacter sichuanensis]